MNQESFRDAVNARQAAEKEEKRKQAALNRELKRQESDMEKHKRNLVADFERFLKMVRKSDLFHDGSSEKVVVPEREDLTKFLPDDIRSVVETYRPRWTAISLMQDEVTEKLNVMFKRSTDESVQPGLSLTILMTRKRGLFDNSATTLQVMMVNADNGFYPPPQLEAIVDSYRPNQDVNSLDDTVRHYLAARDILAWTRSEFTRAVENPVEPNKPIIKEIRAIRETPMVIKGIPESAIPPKEG